MNRMHIHLNVKSLDTSIKFYTELFGLEPAKVKPDYAKWMLEDPRINFAISTREGRNGLNHLGLQVDEDNELTEVRERINKAEISTFDEGETICCYSKSEKTWVQDPAGVPWEVFKTMEDAQIFSDRDQSTDDGSACCAPEAQQPIGLDSLTQIQPPESGGSCC